MGTTGRARYTMDVRTICETYANVEAPGWSDQTTVDQIIDTALPSIFNFSFPIFSEDYRKQLEHHIIQHFYTREIAFQTVGRWKLGLQQTLNDIMPYYNQLYESQILEIDPFENLKWSEKTDTSGSSTSTTKNTRDGETNGTSRTEADSTNDGTSSTETSGKTNTNNSQDTTSSHKDAFSDTPQGSLSNVENNTYLTDYRSISDDKNVTDTGEQTTSGTADVTDHSESNDVSNTTTNSTTTSTENGTGTTENTGTMTREVTGKNTSTSYSELLQQYRDTFLNIDMMIIDELEPLFLQIYDPFGFA